jgi:two-component system, OmpR family, sensor histidine kinase QseC
MQARDSIKRRVLLLVLGAVALVWAITAGVVYFDARHEINEVLDGHLAQAASLIISQTAREVSEAESMHAPVLHRDSRRVAFQIWDRGVLKLHSGNAPDEPLARRDDGYSDTVVQGKRWRVFSSRDPHSGLIVQVGERDDVRKELARDVALNLLHPLIYALPLLGLLLWLAISRAMRPLDEVAGAVSARDPGNLAALAVPQAPREVAPLLDALNRLFARIESSIAGEKRFTADAAHELRTPVAAIRAQAQVARGAVTDDERTRALDNVIAGCDRAAHLVDQLLMLARVDQSAETAPAECSLRNAAADALSDVAAYSIAKGVRLELAPGEDEHVAGHGALLRVMLRNLVDNAVRYSHAGTRVIVAVERKDAQAAVTVADEGPGIPADERERVFERFYRGLGSGVEGTGLGLSIVKRIADIHGASVVLSQQAGKGLAVTVAFAALHSSRHV